jgi:PKD repeat protein
VALADDLRIDSVKWESGDDELRLEGRGRDDRTVTVTNARDASQVLGSDRVDDDEWRLRVSNPNPVPCTVRATQSDGREVTREVANAPADCDQLAGSDDGDGGTTGDFRITSASWDDDDERIRVRGEGDEDRDVLVRNALDLSQVLGRDEVEDDGDWRVKDEDPSPVPCRVRAEQEDGQFDEMDVANAPSDCAPKGGGTDPNQAPTADAHGPYSGTTGIALSFTSNGSNDSDGSINAYAWSFGDGGSSTQANPTHIYENRGTYTVTLTVTDNDGATDSDSTTANIADPLGNVPPTANANGPYSETLGTAVNFSSTGSNDSDGNIVSYSWDFGDNSSSTQANPSHAYAAAGTYNVTLTVTDSDGDSANDTTSATITDPAVNTAPIANANGPYSGTTDLAVNFSSAGSNDSDGSIDSYAWDFGDGGTSTAANPSHTYLLAGDYDVVLTVTDNEGATGTDQTTATISDAVACTSDIPEHCTITDYTGPEVCVSCHKGQAVEMHGSVHYQQTGPTDFVTNIIGLAGERGNGEIGINTYCGTHENSPRFTCAGCHVGNGRFPLPDLPASEPALSNELANIDCLTCHQGVYKRFPDFTVTPFKNLEIVAAGADGRPDPTAPPIVRTGLQGIPDIPVDGDFLFTPAGSELVAEAASLGFDLPIVPMPGSALEAAQSVHRTTRQSCLNCHGGAGGGDGTKRGDMSSALVDPTLDVDMHMSSDPGGQGMVCADCHDAGGHRMRGRGLDLRPNDVPPNGNPVGGQFACTACHTGGSVHSQVNNGARFDDHTDRVACQTCHIPTYAKGGVPTEVSRDWENPGFSPAACNGRGGWLPEEIKRGDLVPTYAWFDGTSEVYVLGEQVEGNLPTKVLDDGTQAYVLGMPNGDASSDSAKIYPMKEHLSKLARNTRTNTLVPQSTFEFFRTGSFAAAVRSGMEQTAEMNANDPYEVVQVHTYQTINHGVEPAGNALGAGGTCGSCHDVPMSEFSGGKPLRMNLERDMGYEVTRAGIGNTQSNGDVSCNLSCHGKDHESKEANFLEIHRRKDHRPEEGAECTECHANR